MSAFTLDGVAAIAAAAIALDIPRPNVGTADRRSRRATVAEFPAWRDAGYVTDDGAVCVGCGEFTPWAGIELGHIEPYAVCMVRYGKSPLTAMLPECGPCNRAHGAAAMPFAPRYGWGVDAPARVPGGMVKAPSGDDYKYAGTRGYDCSPAVMARKIAKWLPPID